MSSSQFISQAEIIQLLDLQPDTPLNILIKTFYKSQLASWETLKNNSLSLQKTLQKEFIYSKSKIIVRSISHRIKSTSAKVDKENIESRSCFLCKKSLPLEQKGLILLDKYVLLCNPYPVFKNHFTLPLIEHKPQKIINYITDMINFSENLGEDLLIFYNGPECGASAPDHFHFQVCNQHDLPLVNFIQNYQHKYESSGSVNKDVAILINKDFPINHFVIKSVDKQKLLSSWNAVYDSLTEKQKENKEPLLNLLSFYNDHNYYLVVFPRKKHRPDCFYAKGDNKILTSPAVIDLSGVLILPRPEDFNKITSSDIIKIFNEVMLPLDFIEQLLKTTFF